MWAHIYQFTETPIEANSEHNGHVKIEKLENFELEISEPPVFRPFKPIYHLTMGMFSHTAK